MTSPERICLFFAAEPARPGEEKPASEFAWWRPSLTRVRPPGSPLWPFGVWWLLHHLRVFQGREYSVLLRLEDGVPVHRACVFPRFYRFPFMSATDLQIGDVWTAPAARGQGIAQRSIATILHRFGGRRVWYVTEASNAASIVVAERSGMRVRGRGTRTRRFGVSALGQFRIEEPVD